MWRWTPRKVIITANEVQWAPRGVFIGGRVKWSICMEVKEHCRESFLGMAEIPLSWKEQVGLGEKSLKNCGSSSPPWLHPKNMHILKAAPNKSVRSASLFWFCSSEGESYLPFFFNRDSIRSGTENTQVFPWSSRCCGKYQKILINSRKEFQWFL